MPPAQGSGEDTHREHQCLHKTVCQATISGRGRQSTGQTRALPLRKGEGTGLSTAAGPERVRRVGGGVQLKASNLKSGTFPWMVVDDTLNIPIASNSDFS